MRFRARHVLSAGLAIVLSVLAPVIGIFGWWAYGRQASGVPIVKLQFAGNAADARVLGQGESFQRAIAADWSLILAYGIALSLGCALGMYVARTVRGRMIGAAGLTATVVAVVADLVENALLLAGLARLPNAPDALFSGAAAAATIKFAVLLPAVVIALTACVVTFRRAGAALRRRRRRRPPTAGQRDTTIPPPPIMTAEDEYWPAGDPPRNRDNTPAASRWDYGANVPRTRDPAAVGFCVSGGGIRSASVTLGALDTLRTELIKARYLVSVSGGGYAAGALQLAMQPLSKDEAIDGDPGGPDVDTNGADPADPKDVMTAGSVELDHVRRHGNYIAEGAGEWLIALGVIFRGVAMSLVLIGAAVTVVGIALNSFYAEIPFVDMGTMEKLWESEEPVPLREVVQQRPLFVVLASVGVAVVMWLLGRFIASDRLARARHAVAGAALGVAGVVAVLGVVVPTVWWLSVVWLREALGVAAGVSAGFFSVLGTYLAALVGILWSQRKTIGGMKSPFKGAKGKNDNVTFTRRVADGAVQYLIVWGVLLALAVIYLVILGLSTAVAGEWSPLWTIGLPVAVVIIAVRLDQTWASLHPFYRRRLASAFAVRRVSRKERTAAVAYDFEGETTTLSTYGRRPMDDRGVATFPQVIFAAAANLSGQERTPPGRRAVSYTLSHDYIGGPDVGYVKTEHAEAISPRRLRMDLTVQSAIAVSGAAFASAMGGQARAIQTLFALSNARLGTWLPNPAVIDRGDETGDWRILGLPSVRRLSYQLREVFGQYGYDDRLLYVTDGGHYENLGLVELLRHGCKKVFCIDGSGDSPPFATTLAEAITLAYEELGVVIRLKDAADAVPGSGDPLEPETALATLNARLSRSAVLSGTIEYPKELPFDDGTTGKTGRLYVAKALLTPNTPYELLSYSAAHDDFPRDSTGDQWFGHAQFNAYYALGRHIGEETLKLVAADEADPDTAGCAWWPPSVWFGGGAVPESE